MTEVARRGSVRSAAQTLNVAASAVNRQILKLEDELGVKLFDRLPSGMRPTPAGEILLRHVRDTMLGFERSVAEIEGLSGLLSGHVRIVALDSFLIDFLPECIATFAERYPAVTFSVSAASSRNVVQQIQDGDADIGLTFDGPTSSALRRVASVLAPIGALMMPDHPLARRTLLSFDDLLPYSSLLFARDNVSYGTAVDESYTAFRETARARFKSSSIAFSKRMILAGLGIGFFTRIAFHSELQDGRLRWIPLDSHRLSQTRVMILAPNNRTLPPAGDLLLRALEQRLQTV
nr:LysR family transcriptional regulator [Gluconacetobacter azotocaptans]